MSWSSSFRRHMHGAVRSYRGRLKAPFQRAKHWLDDIRETLTEIEQELRLDVPGRRFPTNDLGASTS